MCQDVEINRSQIVFCLRWNKSAQCGWQLRGNVDITSGPGIKKRKKRMRHKYVKISPSGQGQRYKLNNNEIHKKHNLGQEIDEGLVSADKESRLLKDRIYDYTRIQAPCFRSNARFVFSDSYPSAPTDILCGNLYRNSTSIGLEGSQGPGIHAIQFPNVLNRR